MEEHRPNTIYGTTILSVRKGDEVVIVGDGQVTFGNSVMKSTAKKIKELSDGKILTGFAGSTADAFALFERLEHKLERHPDNLTRACLELAKDWRTDKYLRHLEAMMIVVDKNITLIISGHGDVVEPEGGIAAIGSGGNYALSAAKALYDIDNMDDERYLLNKNERGSVEDLVRSFTINGAYQIFRENEIGSLEVGKYADFIIIDRDIFNINPIDIENTKVLKTFFNGCLVYDSDEDKK